VAICCIPPLQHGATGAEANKFGAPQERFGGDTTRLLEI